MIPWIAPACTSILNEVVKKHGFPPDVILGRERFRPVVRARHELWFRVHSELGWSYYMMARYFNVDHTTIMHAVRKVENEHKN